jgi:hypothetical protein
MKIRWLLSLSLFSLAACPPPPAPSADAQPDAQPEAAVPSDAQSDAGGAMDVASQPDASNGDAAAIACCVALTGTAQSVCDPLAALGPDRCNMINGGTSCAWNPAAACNGDAGASQPDVVRPDANASACCVARPGTAQSVCDPLAALGPDRCNMINGGASCMWAGGATCGDAGAPVDSGVRVDSGVSVDSGVRVDSGVAGCCRARPGIAQATCDAVASFGQDRCNMLNGGASCAWLTGGECLTDAGPRADASCCTARAGVAQSTCDAVAALGRDRCNMLNAGASCSWTCL